MQAVYRLDKMKSKNLILIIMGFAKYRDQAGHILFKSSRMLRRLLSSEIRTSFLTYTEEDEGVDLHSISSMPFSGIRIPNVFNVSIFERKLNIRLSQWKLIKGIWKDSFRVKELIIDIEKRNFDGRKDSLDQADAD